MYGCHLDLNVGTNVVGDSSGGAGGAGGGSAGGGQICLTICWRAESRRCREMEPHAGAHAGQTGQGQEASMTTLHTGSDPGARK